jgi:hypothetical protein
MTALPSIALSEFALRVAARPSMGDWFVLATPVVLLSETLESLAEDVEAFMKRRPATIFSVRGPREMAAFIRSAGEPVVLLSGFENFSRNDWETADLMRSRFEGDRTAALLMSESQLAVFVEAAPNLASWLGAGMWRLDKDIEQLTAEERVARLVALRVEMGASDADVISRAESGTLGTEPQFAEWLVLLGRSDLLGRR